VAVGVAPEEHLELEHAEGLRHVLLANAPLT